MRGSDRAAQRGGRPDERVGARQRRSAQDRADLRAETAAGYEHQALGASRGTGSRTASRSRRRASARRASRARGRARPADHADRRRAPLASSRRRRAPTRRARAGRARRPCGAAPVVRSPPASSRNCRPSRGSAAAPGRSPTWTKATDRPWSMVVLRSIALISTPSTALAFARSTATGATRSARIRRSTRASGNPRDRATRPLAGTSGKPPGTSLRGHPVPTARIAGKVRSRTRRGTARDCARGTALPDQRRPGGQWGSGRSAAAGCVSTAPGRGRGAGGR